MWCFRLSGHRGRVLPTSGVLPEISCNSAGFLKINDRGGRLTSGHLPVHIKPPSLPGVVSHAVWAASCSLVQPWLNPENLWSIRVVCAPQQLDWSIWGGKKTLTPRVLSKNILNLHEQCVENKHFCRKQGVEDVETRDELIKNQRVYLQSWHCEGCWDFVNY